jgi:hypothetical protein
MKQLQAVELEIRNDPAGSGYFGASRDGGTRAHNGVDYVCVPYMPVLSPINGKVSKHGIVYGDDHQWRYIEITDSDGLRHRFMYVDPGIEKGGRVAVGDNMGRAQDISQRYIERDAPLCNMLPHIHYGIKDSQGNYLDPTG